MLGPAHADDSYPGAVSAVETALVQINTDPERGIDTLRAALVHLREFTPQLAGDPKTLELRLLAELALARAQLASGDRYAAAATIDAALEALADAPLPSDRLGPGLGALVAERQRALEARGFARLRVECPTKCRVLINERNAGDVDTPGSARELALPLGTHRVWVESLAEDATADADPLRTTVSLDAADTVVTVTYSGSAETADSPVPTRGQANTGERPLELGPQRQRHRTAPRWAEVTTLVAGGAALVAGAVLLAIDSRCPRGADPNDLAACPELYDTRTGGIALVSAGFAASLTGGVMLIVDETRMGDRRGTELGLVWTTRF
ncbi:hypothetical protein DB30_05809 [Enhygromyxa salina]|uniref:PEGA domain-containing protein n=1 Tax=Enhygromyxa salina TaxID=215803 RepID=A0A0C2D0B2_9BACT|nr:hypothetical protein [Enhygromyxa salina]KIG15265.1 hypothetical protein DB30_05809 [Enhygromyxa salina]